MEREVGPVHEPRVPTWWLRLWGGAAAFGAVLSPLVLGVVPALTLWVAGCVMAMIASGILAPSGRPFNWARAAGSAALWAAAFAALTAALQVMGSAALWIPIAAALSSLRFHRTVGRFTRTAGVPPPPDSTSAQPVHDDVLPPRRPRTENALGPVHQYIPVDAGPAMVAAMDTALLCRVWRSSFLGLNAARDGTEMLEVVRVRQLLLDELHRRHLPEVRAWISAGGRAASGPERFLGPATRPTRDGSNGTDTPESRSDAKGL